jgi:hypothetical protein
MNEDHGHRSRWQCAIISASESEFLFPENYFSDIIWDKGGK